MPIDFPDSPSPDDVFTSGNRSWKWVGSVWRAITGATANYLNDLFDVDTTGKTSGDFLKYDGTNWVPDSIPTINALDDVGDVTITSVASGDFLQWNGTAWVNESAPTYVQFDSSVGSPTAAEGKLQWDSDFGTLSFGLEGSNSVQHIGVNQFAYCYNADSVTLTKGTPVYIFGGQGSQVSIKRAFNTSDEGSARTLGLVSESITAGASGYVCTYGVLQGIDTSGYTVGQILYLGSTAGTLTTTKPAAPNHYVFIGVVIKADVGGEIWLRPQNGYELDEIHDVSIVDKTSGDFLKYNGTLWVNDQINLGTDTVGNYVADVTAGTGVTVTHTPGEGSSPTIGIGQAVASTDSPTFAGLTADNVQVGITGTNEIDTVSGNLTIDSAGGTVTVDDNLIVSGDLTVNGTTTTLNTENLAVEDNIIVLNSNVTGSPALNAGIEVERGTSDNVLIRWNETDDKWQITNDGTTYGSIATESYVNTRTDSIDGIGDVTITTPVSGESLTYNGAAWVNQQVIPSGSITQFAGSSAPTGWLICDGSNVSRTTYASLFAVVGTTYGSGDGSTTFSLPNMKGRVPVGRDAAQTEFDTLAETGGAKTHTLTTSEMPSHTHTQDSHNHSQNSHSHSTVNAGNHAHTIYGINTGIPAGTNGFGLGMLRLNDGGYNYASTVAGDHGHTINGQTATNIATTATNQNTGGGGAHNNLQPYIVLNYIIKA